MKKITKSGQKKNKENRGYNGKNTNLGKECMQPQRESRGVEMLMEVDNGKVRE